MDPASLSRKRDVVLLGSTGSIGTQAADIVRRNPDRFALTALAAGGGNPGLLAEQAIEFGVEVVAVASEAAAPEVKTALAALARGGAPPPEVLAGPAAVAEVAAWPADIVLNAVTGAVGLAATLAALDAGRVLALANKESLIMGGRLVTGRAAAGQIVPVDSEHSAIAQCLRAGRADEVRKLVVTASGGPFLRWTSEQMSTATPAQALAHPTWNMGPVITINSATLVNKGLEVIEAHLLFGIDLDDIEVVVHRQSVIHSMVEFTDGSTIAQASPPDMRLPIAHALAWPERVADAASPVDWSQSYSWTFEPLDDDAFPAVALARAAGRAAGTQPAVYNAANEECVAAFVAGRIGFGRIVDTIAQVVSEHDGSGPGFGLDDVLAADSWARLRARELTRTAASARYGGAPAHLRAQGAREGRTSQVSYLIGVLIFVVAILVSIMLHEFGHFATAKAFHMKATQFFVGFGNTLWSVRRGETEYGVKSLPLGGFVKIVGMTSMDDVDPADEPRSFRSKPGWQRVIVLSAGSFMHFMIALVLLWVLAFGIGAQVPKSTLVTVSACVPARLHAPCAPGDPASPAINAGIKTGDKVIAVAGQRVRGFTAMVNAIKSQPGGVPVTLIVRRGGQTKNIQVTLARPRWDTQKINHKATRVSFLGVSPVYVYHRAGPIAAVGQAGSGFGSIVSASAVGLSRIPCAIPVLFSKNRASSPCGQLSSVVGAANDTGQVVAGGYNWRQTVSFLLYIVISVNIFVGIFNLLPLLPLDGGHIAIVGYERLRAAVARLRRGPVLGLVDISRLIPVSMGVFALLVSLSLLLIAADIINPLSLTQ